MTTAPQENRGGDRPTASQNNPANVNGQGGNGQSGKYTGFAYGQNQAVNNQRVEGNKAMASAQAATPSASMNPLDELQGLFSDITPIDAPPSDPTLPISTGVNVGRGAGEESLPALYRADQRQIENLDLIKKYLPDLINATRVDNAPDSYKQFVNFLKSQVI